MKKYRIELENDQGGTVVTNLKYYAISQMLKNNYDFVTYDDKNGETICECTNEIYLDFLLTYEKISFDFFGFKLLEIV